MGLGIVLPTDHLLVDHPSYGTVRRDLSFYAMLSHGAHHHALQPQHRGTLILSPGLGPWIRSRLGLISAKRIRLPIHHHGGSIGITRIRFDETNLKFEEIIGTNLTRADLSGADVFKTNLDNAKLIEAKLRGANLSDANLIGADLSRTDLTGANLAGANLTRANLGEATLTGTELMHATLVETNFTGADLTGCRIYGVSAWNLTLDKTRQHNLVIARQDEPEITVDNIEVAQFIYLMLHNEKIRDVIDTITSKVVLILGRFTDERKAVLDTLREELRNRNYLPILFDFEKPRSRDTDETVTLLARMARFIIVDISDAKSVLQELRAIVPDLPSVPVQAIILAIQEEPGMFDFYRNMRSFLPVHRYADQNELLADLGDKVIHPAELKVLELRG